MSRPSELTDAKVKRIVAMVKRGDTLRDAAAKVGISMSTLDAWMRSPDGAPIRTALNDRPRSKFSDGSVDAAAKGGSRRTSSPRGKE